MERMTVGMIELEGIWDAVCLEAIAVKSAGEILSFHPGAILFLLMSLQNKGRIVVVSFLSSLLIQNFCMQKNIAFQSKKIVTLTTL